MTRRARFALTLAAAAALGAFAVLLASGQEGTRPADDTADEPPRAAIDERVVESVAGSEREREAAAARREDPRGEPGPRPSDLAAIHRVADQAEPVGRDFFSAFSRYELGTGHQIVRRTIEATTTPAFARELLAAPPRPAPASGDLVRARLRRIEFVPGAVAGGEIRGADLVGVTVRGDARAPVAIALVRRGERWLVEGLGR